MVTALVSRMKRDEILFVMPESEELDDGMMPGGNREYTDLRGSTWGDASEALEQDVDLILRLRDCADPHSELEKYIASRLRVSLDDQNFDAYDLLGRSIYSRLDPGVASTVLALSASGAAPITSCNGGIFGDCHQELFPLVCFFAPPDVGIWIAELAAESGLILEQNSITRSPVLSSLKIEPFVRFAELLVSGGAFEMVNGGPSRAAFRPRCGRPIPARCEPYAIV